MVKDKPRKKEMSTPKPMTEEQAVSALKRLAKRWPKSLWLWSASGSLHVMKCGEDRNRIETPTGGYSSRAIIESIEGIPNDGGDW